MFQSTIKTPRETEVEIERVKTAVAQIPTAVFVTVANAAVMTAVLAEAGQPHGTAWFALSVLVAATRLALWWTYRRATPTPSQYRGWARLSICGAFAAGLLWGGGSVLLFPHSETYQLFWAFLIAGMCAGASALHYAHLPSTLAFVLPAGIPLAIRFALEGSGQRTAAAAMIAVFLTALVVTARRSSRYFGETVRLRLDLAHRTRELDAANTRLHVEMAERRTTEASLRHAQKMEAVGQLTGGIAHDFNNLLTAVLGSLALLRKHLPPGTPKALRLLDNAVQGAERGAALTHRLLAFGRRQALRPELVHVPTLVPGMSALLRSSLGTSVRFVQRFPATLAPVQVDANQLELALLNLVVNARDAMPDGGTITLSAHEEPPPPDDPTPQPYVVISVSDTGRGMDEATLARAMEPFFTTKGVGKGTGLGLAMVHGFAAQSGGHFILHSQPGLGATAELWLPQAHATPATTPLAPHPATPRKPTRRCRVLVVDDDPLVLASTVSMLEDLGHDVVEARSGPDALALLPDHAPFDLVATDYAMPGMTGLQLAGELRRREPLLPILLVTGYAELPANAVTSLGYLSKPFGLDALSEAVDRCLASVAQQ